MTKADFIDAVYAQAEAGGYALTKKQASEMVDAVFASLADSIRKDERFSYPGFGTFSVRERSAREGRNPQTGETIQIPASKSVGFKPAPKFKESLGVPETATKKKRARRK